MSNISRKSWPSAGRHGSTLIGVRSAAAIFGLSVWTIGASASPVSKPATTADFAQSASTLTPPFPLVAAKTGWEKVYGTFGWPWTLRTVILPFGQWAPYPTAQDRAPWEAIPSEARTLWVGAAEKLLGCNWPQLKATDYLKFKRTGNRSDYEKPFSERGRMLMTLVLGEAIEHKGRFLDDIVNGIWAICEETSWAVPAGAQGAPGSRANRLFQMDGSGRIDHTEGSGLPNIDDPVVELTAPITAATLAWTSYLLGPELDNISPLIRERIAREVSQRVLTPALQKDDLRWMGFTGVKFSNWTPYICSNWLAADLILESNETRRIETVTKVMQILQMYLQSYPADGGDDEGPGYWSASGAGLYDCLHMLETASGGKINWMKIPVVRPMGEFIVNAHIAGPYYIDMGDAEAKAGGGVAMEVYQYGKSIRSEAMMGLAAATARRNGLNAEFRGIGVTPLYRSLAVLFGWDELSKCALPETLPRDVWLPDLQLMAARDKQDQTDGLYVAAWAGNNGHSHNHNDVGNLIVYADGRPVLIDVGAMNYTAETFSTRRYEIWNNQSAYHNCPTINGVMESAGTESAASDVRYLSNDARATISMNIAGAYPPEAKVKVWNRTVAFNRGKSVVLSDAYQLAEYKTAPVWNFMTAAAPDLSARGKLRLQAPMEGGKPPVFVTVGFNPDLLEARSEEIDVPPGLLRESWGDKLWRIQLQSRSPALSGQMSLSMTLEPLR